MTTAERIAINRTKGLNSTGPKSDEGTKHSALNAYTEFLKSFQDDLNPDHCWSLNRASA